MGYDSSQRGSGIGVVVVVVLLLGFFVFLFLGIGAVMLMYRAQSNPATPAFATAASSVASGPGGQPQLQLADGTYVSSMPTVYLDSAGQVDVDGELVPLETVGKRVDELALLRGGEYLTVNVVVAPECPVGSFMSVLEQIRASTFCDYDFSAVQVATMNRNPPPADDPEEGETERPTSEEETPGDDVSGDDVAEEAASEDVDVESDDARADDSSATDSDENTSDEETSEAESSYKETLTSGDPPADSDAG